MKILFPLAILSVILLSCKATENAEATDATQQSDMEKPQKNVRIKAVIGNAGESDPITITDAKVVGNKLFLVVEYSGGCKQHSFQLIGEEAVMKSLPPKRRITLVHDANEDNCRALITDTIEADIEALSMSETHGSEIILILSGYKDELTYIFE